MTFAACAFPVSVLIFSSPGKTTIQFYVPIVGRKVEAAEGEEEFLSVQLLRMVICLEHFIQQI